MYNVLFSKGSGSTFLQYFMQKKIKLQTYFRNEVIGKQLTWALKNVSDMIMTTIKSFSTQRKNHQAFVPKIMIKTQQPRSLASTTIIFCAHPRQKYCLATVSLNKFEPLLCSYMFRLLVKPFLDHFYRINSETLEKWFPCSTKVWHGTYQAKKDNIKSHSRHDIIVSCW